jgi:hypothetical protein
MDSQTQQPSESEIARLIEQQRKRREYNRRYRENHKDYFRQKAKEWRQRQKSGHEPKA